MSREAETILVDLDGNSFQLYARGGQVHIWMPAKHAALGPEQQEAFGQAYIAACNAADRQRAASRD